LVQVAYAIGEADPVGLFVNTYGTAKVYMNDGQIAAVISKIPEFNLRPFYIENRFKLRTPIYSETAAYGHMGRESKKIEKTFNKGKKNELTVNVELFPWEKLNCVDVVKRAFKI
jgi:S-adenosylmethionine synthetase